MKMKCYNCGEERKTFVVHLLGENGYEPIDCCGDCYEDWYLK